METNQIKDRVNYLIDLCNRALASKVTDAGTIPHNRVNAELFAELRSAGLVLLLSAYQVDHPFYKEFDNAVRTNSPRDVERGLGILKAVKFHVEN